MNKPEWKKKIRLVCLVRRRDWNVPLGKMVGSMQNKKEQHSNIDSCFVVLFCFVLFYSIPINILDFQTMDVCHCTAYTLRSCVFVTLHYCTSKKCTVDSQPVLTELNQRLWALEGAPGRSVRPTEFPPQSDRTDRIPTYMQRTGPTGPAYLPAMDRPDRKTEVSWSNRAE